MVYENEDQKSNHQYNNLILEIVHKDANESLKLLSDNVNSINTRLTLLIGFNATFASLLPRLPIQNIFSVKTYHLQEIESLYPHAREILVKIILVINWFLLMKPLIALLLGISLTLAILSVIPSPTELVLLPEKMLEKGKEFSEEDLILGIIQNRDVTIQKLQKLLAEKASNLKYSLRALASAALFTIFDILTNSKI
jgi:hypothetical protein